MKLLSLFTLSLALLSINTETDSVYICNGSASTKYHLSPKCRGLVRCTTLIEEIPIDEAKKKGRTLCGYED